MITTSNNTFPLKPIRSTDLENLKGLNRKLHEVYEKIKSSGLQINDSSNNTSNNNNNNNNLVNNNNSNNNNNNNKNNNKLSVSWSYNIF